MSGTDFAGEATAELYGSDPEAFTERRAALASQARAAGDRAAAKEIAGLRKPTRPAWMINQLARADPGAIGRLASLGDELRAAAAALDGAKIRELSQERRTLVDTLIRRTLQQAGERSPSAALREDLTATFGAALADPQVARDLAAGTLVRAVHHADFGTGAPELTLVPPPADHGTRAAQPEAAAQPTAARQVQTGKAAKARAAEEQARAARAAQEAREARAAEERRRALSEAEQALAEASRAAAQAAQAEQEERDHVQALESQLDEARRRVSEARRRVRETQLAQQQARRALGRLPPG